MKPKKKQSQPRSPDDKRAPSKKRPANDPARLAEPRTNTDRDVAYREGLVKHETSSATTYDKVWASSRFVPRQHTTPLLSKYEIMKGILDFQGVIL